MAMAMTVAMVVCGKRTNFTVVVLLVIVFGAVHHWRRLCARCLLKSKRVHKARRPAVDDTTAGSCRYGDVRCAAMRPCMTVARLCCDAETVHAVEAQS